jgi:hypothetical protein
MAVLVMGDPRAGVCAAYEHPTRHGHRAQAVLIADRDGRGRGFDVHESATMPTVRSEQTVAAVW